MGAVKSDGTLGPLLTPPGKTTRQSSPPTAANEYTLRRLRCHTSAVSSPSCAASEFVQCAHHSMLTAVWAGTTAGDSCALSTSRSIRLPARASLVVFALLFAEGEVQPAHALATLAFVRN